MDEAAPPDRLEIEVQAELLRVVQDNIPICIWMVDQDGTFLHHAGQGLAAAGLTPGQFLGKNIFELYAGGPGVEMIRGAYAGQIGHTISEQHGAFWETWYIPVRDAGGEVTRVTGVTLDVTPVKRAELELREKLELIERQQQVIRALSTPIIEVWDKVLTVPMLGVLDSSRASDVMESLLKRVSEKGARFAVLDMTGIDMIDTGTAAHLLKMIQALRLLGAEGVITGLRPDVAQTMVTLGVDLEDIATRANLRDGLRYCIKRMREGVG